MPERVRLGQEGAVGVAVHLHLVVAERRSHVVDVVGGGGGPVGVEALAELLRARRHADVVGGAAALHVRAVDRLRATGAAGVDEDQLAVVEQVAERVDVAAGAADRAVPRPTLDGDDRSLRGRAAVGARAHRERDRDLPERRVGALERELDLAAEQALRGLRRRGSGSRSAREMLSGASGSAARLPRSRSRRRRPRNRTPARPRRAARRPRRQTAGARAAGAAAISSG